VSFTDQQKEQIAAMVEAGDTAGAQTLILKELEKEFGGAAAAATDPAKKAAVAWGNFKETLGGLVLPVVDRLQSFLADRVVPVLEDKVVPALQRFSAFFTAEILPRVREVADTWLPRLAAAFRNVAGFLTGTVVPALSTLAGFISRNRDFFIPFVQILGVALVAFKAFMFIKTVIAAIWAFNAALIANPIGLVIIAIAAMAAGLIYAYKHSETFRKVVDTAFRVIVAVARWWFENVVKRYIAGVVIAFKFVVEWAQRLWRGVQLYFGFWKGLLMAVAGWVVGVKNRIVANFTAVVNFVKGLPGRVRSAASGLFDGIRNAFRSALNWIIDKWNSLGFTLPVIEFLGKTIGGQTFRVPQIPRFHSGGIVSGIGDQLIVARPGEGVFTRDQMAALAPAGAAGVTVENMTIHAWSDRFSLRQVQDELALHGVV
jgi:phage-related protein